MTEVVQIEQRTEIRPGCDVIASTANELRAQIKTVLERGTRELQIDLEGVEMIDSVGLGLFIAAHNSLQKAGGKLTVVNASGHLSDLFRNMRLDQHFSVIRASSGR
jgi:anti-anti-sigma factor